MNDDDRHVLCPVPKTGNPGDEWECPRCGWMYRALDPEASTFFGPRWWPVGETWQVAR